MIIKIKKCDNCGLEDNSTVKEYKNNNFEHLCDYCILSLNEQIEGDKND